MGRRLRSSIIVVTYNHRQYIEGCLRALLPTLTDEDEAIVIDNGSSDGTPQLVTAMFPTVRFSQNRFNVGFGAACNQAALASDAEFLVFLNPDTEARRGWLDPLVAPLQQHSDVGLTTPKILLRAHPELIDTFGHDVHISGISTCRGWGRPSDAHAEPEVVGAVSGACFAIRRRVFAKLGGFDERLFLYYEDDDLSLRARLAGYKCLATPASEIVHDHRPGFSPQKLRYLERNRWYAMLKLLKLRTLITLVPVLIGAEVLVWGMALWRGPRHAIAKAQSYRDVLGWLVLLPREREQVVRVVSDRELLQLHAAVVKADQVSSSSFVRHLEWVVSNAFQALRLLPLRLAAG